MGMFGNIGAGLKSLVTPENLMLLGATMKDIGSGGSENFMGAQQMITARQAKAAEREWAQGLLQSLGGQGGGGMLPTLPGSGPAALAGPGTGQAGNPGEISGVVQGGARPPPSLRELMPLLTTGALRGYKGVGDLVSILDKTGPDMDFVNGIAVDRRAAKAGEKVGVDLSSVNGFMVDKQDPKNANRFFGEPPVKGAKPIFDQDGRHSGWQMMDGSLQAIQATSAAETAGRTGETFYKVPNADGSETFMRGKDYLSGGGPGGGIGSTQTPGGKIEQEGKARISVERLGLEPKAAAALDSQARTTDLVLSKIDEALGKVSGATAGFAGLTSVIPGTPAKDLSATLDTIRGNVGFDKLAEMRANSPTGGALGSVTEKENAVLQSVLGSIDQGQSPEQLRENLTRIREQLIAARDARKTAYAGTYAPKPASSPARPAARQAPAQRGYSVVGVRRGGQ